MVAFKNTAKAKAGLIRRVNRARAKEGLAPVRWPRNGLRHSFCSYRLAAIKHVGQVALEAGNSPKVIFSNYRELVRERDAVAWFNVRPEAGQ